MIGPATSIAVEGYHVLHVRMGSQTGTHVDAPFHVRDDGLRIDELPLSRFLAPLVVADLRGAGAAYGCVVGAPGAGRRAAGAGRRARAAHRLGRAPGHAGVLRPPVPLAATARVLELGVRTIGLDAASLDEAVLDAGRPELPSHQLVAAADGVIVENLTALETVDLPEPWLSVLPLRLTAADGAPCRAVALELPARWQAGG